MSTVPGPALVKRNMLARQRHRCLGCLAPLSMSTAEHDSNGLLCQGCINGLEAVQRKPDVLRRLMAYLKYDPTKTNVYLIGALKNPNVQTIAAKLRAKGYNVWDDWHSAGPEADEYWQRYEEARGRTYAEALDGIHATDVFLFDRSYLDLADIAVLVMPAGKSGHLEFGYFTGGGKPGFILLDEEPKRYDVMPNFATRVVYSTDELFAQMGKVRVRG